MTQKYRTIVADPPWDYAGKSPPWRSSSKPPYAMMSVKDLCELPISSIASADAHLYLWSVLPMMEEAYRVVKSWGFTPETAITWCKPGPGLGGGFRGNTEHLIVARRGWSSVNPTCSTCGGRARGIRKCACEIPAWRVKGVPLEETDAQRKPFRSTFKGTWIVAPRAAHSVKPEIFQDIIEQMSHAPYLELFARRKRLGWHSWGNEVDSDITL